MSAPRSSPFELVFRYTISTSFPAIQAALKGPGQDPRDRDAFLMIGDVIMLLRELRPAEGLGEGIDQLAALVHHAYLFWDAGERTVEVDDNRLPELLGTVQVSDQQNVSATYAQLPERRIWGAPVPDAPQEPLDGCFIYGSPEDRSLHVLGVFGVHPERAGFSVVEVVGERPRALVRADGSALFSPVLPGGQAAGLFSITGEEELLELSWRLLVAAMAPAVEAG
jgi:hypothetical protein